ncbi:hypothetical protein DAI22_12g056001 [Oryza sativa Japonica Group]|nr:hypothetical protein DAI22_12g056001 [Oryza sativa Japonica Group]
MVRDRLKDRTDILFKLNSVVWISPSSTSLHELLGGVASDFTDGHASSFSGRLQKTELAHTICVTSQLPTGTHEATGKIAYIDTEGTFDPEKLVKIAERLGVEATPVIQNTVYASAYTYEDMEALLSDLQSKMEKEPFKMLIINSVTTLFNTELCNGCAFDGCQIKTLEMMYCLRMIANKFHIGVYVTNHEEMGLTDAKIKRSLKQGLYFKEVKDLRKLNNAVQVTTGNSSLGDMHQGGDMHEERYNGCTKTVCGRKHETVCANSQRLLDFRTKIRVSYPNSWFYLDASPDDKIKQLSQMIEKRISLSRESFYLTYLGRKLEPESTLRELGLVVSLITFELHVRLRGGCPDKGNQSLREFIASNSVCWITMSHGKNLYSNRLVREVLVRYPGQKGMRQVVKLVMQPLAIRICNGIASRTQGT